MGVVMTYRRFPKRVFVQGLAALTLMAAGTAAQAQGGGAALTEARARLACGTGTPVSAVYLPSGAIEVTCRRNLRRVATDTAAASQNQPSDPLGGTGLTTPPVGAAVAATIILGIVVGEGGSATTTSTGSD